MRLEGKKCLKRRWTVSDDGSTSHIPLKKRIIDRMEKENKLLERRKSTSFRNSHKRGNKILEDAQLPNYETNTEVSEDLNSLSGNESDNDDWNEMFVKLKKSGVKAIRSSLNSSKSPNSSKISDQVTPTKRNSLRSKSKTPSSQKKSRESVEKNLSSSEKKITKIDFERKIPELEKLPEDLILNYKRTPKKTDVGEQETPTKQRSIETPVRRSSRRRSTVIDEVILNVLERTPVRRVSKTPSKKSSAKKREVKEPVTPTCKIEEKVPTTPLEKARLSLHVSTVPDSLPCREKEYSNIFTFLENKLWDGIGGCMYISGVPGTGKTATVNQVIRQLQKLAEDGKVPDFKFIEINGMRLSDPRQAYVQLWQKLFEKKEKITPERAQRLLDDWFSKSDRKNTKTTTVLLIDELDLICTKKQDVVYNLLDWPTRTHSRLVVLTIANTMDMPERVFKGRVTSRMGLTRLTFMPYTHKQLEEIVLTRLKGLNAFVDDAVRLVTRKVAAVSGDARRALDICRRATEMPKPEECVKMCHIEQAIREMTNSNIVKVIRSCGEMEKLFLRSLSDVSFRSNVEEVDLREVIDQLLAICVLEGVSRPSVSSILTVSHRLKCSRLIFANQSSCQSGILQRLTLNVTQDDIHYALMT